MQYVVCYDIADDRRRSRVSATLLDFGTRVQESVFVAHLDDELAARMKERLVRLVDEDWDRLQIFEMCATCGAKGWAMGVSKVVEDPEWYIV